MTGAGASRPPTGEQPRVGRGFPRRRRFQYSAWVSGGWARRLQSARISRQPRGGLIRAADATRTSRAATITSPAVTLLGRAIARERALDRAAVDAPTHRGADTVCACAAGPSASEATLARGPTGARGQKAHERRGGPS